MISKIFGSNKLIKFRFALSNKYFLLNCQRLMSTQKTVSYKIKENIAVVKIDIPNSKENTLNEALSNDIVQVFNELQNNDSVKGVVLMSGKPNSFIAGADIGMLQKCKSSTQAEKISRNAQLEFDGLENSKKPIIAAIMGTCMGGGLELALACHYRIAVNNSKTQLAFPEVMLGLLPGAGGTQRLPKLISLTNSLDLMLTGKTIRTDKAKKIGLVDSVVEPLGPGICSELENTHRYLEEIAIKYAQDISQGKLKINRQRPLVERVSNYFLSRRPLIDSVVLRTAREKILKQTAGNYPAPLKILEVVRTGLIDGQPAGFELEAKLFGELTQTFQSAALIGLFQGSTECKKDKYGDAKETKHLGVIGAGLMGAGIANVSCDKNIKTTLIDTSDTALSRGVEQIKKQIDGQVKRKKISFLQGQQALSNIKPSITYDQLKDADVVIEAVFEDLNLKHKIIQNIEAVVPDHCIIASNTSALPIKDIASVSSRPERIIGMHYFSPVDKMQLLEIIITDQTSKEALAVAAKLGLCQKKLNVVVKDCPGFFTVRCLAPMMSEIIRLLQEGVDPLQLDELTKNYGFPVGAATLADEVGLDVGQHVAAFLGEALGPRVRGGSSDLFSDLVNAGHKGRKTNSGIYKYSTEKGKTKKIVNVEAKKILEKYRLEPPNSVSSTTDRQLRVVSRFVNEALLCYQESIISSPADGDIASVFGLGFPPFWGGPFRFVDLYGASLLVSHMQRFGDAYNAVEFQPCNLLLDYAKNGKKFYN